MPAVGDLALPAVTRRARRVGGALTLVLALSACGASPAVERTLGGARRAGAFVSPASYEHFVRGELFASRAEYAEAEREYALARAGVADDPLLVARTAEMRDRRGERAAAERALDEGLRAWPASQALWEARGAIAERHGETGPAAEAYARAVEAADGDEGPVLSLARTLRASGADARADAVLAAWIARVPSSPGALRARLALALAGGRAEDAAVAALDLVRGAPFHADEIEAAARAALEDGHPTLAARLVGALPEGAVDAALRLEIAWRAGARGEVEARLASFEPRGPSAFLLAGACALWLDDPSRARELAARAEASGFESEASLLRGRALVLEGRPVEAAAALAAIPAGSPREAEARAVLGDALRTSGLGALGAEVARP